MSEQKQILEFDKIIGVKYLKEDELPLDFKIIKNPGVRSYCDAIPILSKENYKDGVIVTTDSIKVCHWSPVGLGLKEPETSVQKKIEPIFDELFHGIFIFNMGITSKNHPLQEAIENPDTVTLIGTSENMAKSVEVIGLENFTKDYINQPNISAVSEFSNEDNLTKKERRKRKRHLRSLKFINWLFASKLMSNKPMTKLITRMLKNYSFVKIMDGFLRKFGTGMCFCYGASSIPYATQKANVSFSDAGSISWGGISNKDMVMGLPYYLYEKLEQNVIFE